MEVIIKDCFIKNSTIFGSKNKFSKIITQDVFLKKIKELTLTSYYKDDHIIKNVDKIELIGIKSNKRLYGNDSFYLKFFYFNEKNIECVKFSECYQGSSSSSGSNNIPLLSKKEIKTSNILKKPNYEIISKFAEIINKMKCDETFKTLLKNYINNFDILTKIPILYFDEELNKNVWIIPNCINEAEDIILDYETEIPIFNNNFGQYFDRNNNKSFIILREENIECISINKFHNVNIKIEDLPKNVFVFGYTKDLFNFEDVILTENSNASGKMLMPNIRFINEEKTEKILKMSNSKKTLIEIKTTINEKMNNYSGFNEELKLNDEIEIKSENNLIISEYFDYFKENEDAKLTYQLKNNTSLNNLLVITKENISNPKQTIINTQFKTLDIKNENFLKDISLEDIQPNEYYKINTNFDLELLIPKDKSGEISILKDLNKNNNWSKIFEKNVIYYEDNFIVNKSKENGGKVYYIDEMMEIKHNELIETGNYNELIVFRNNLNNNIIALNKKSRGHEKIDNSKKFKTILNKDISVLNLGTTLTDFEILLTDNNVFYFEKIENNFFPKSDLTQIDYEVVSKKENGNYEVSFLVPIIVEKNYRKFISTKEKETIMKDYKIKNGKRSLNIFDDTKKTYDVLNLNYELNDDNGILNLIIDNKICLNSEDSLKFIYKIQKVNTFNIKEDKDNFFIDILNPEEKIRIVKNKNKEFYLSNFKSNKKQEKLLNLYIKNQIKLKIFNKILNKNIYFSDNKMFLNSVETFSDNNTQDFDRSFEETKNNKNSLLNDNESKVFNYKNDVLEILINEKNEVSGVINKTLNTRNKDFLKNLDFSL